jgi:Pyrimidine dimer DNA glycosylase
MRIWDVPLLQLCPAHLLGEHRELHAVWTILTQGKTGYRQHPETRRWVGKQAALYRRHTELVFEMQRRGYTHRSPLDPALAVGESEQTVFLDSLERQRELLRAKSCACYPSQATDQSTEAS